MKNNFFKVNKIGLSILVIILVVMAMSFGLYKIFFSDHDPYNHDKHEKSANLYICPMHPQITSDRKTTCPICGMDLVLAAELEEDDEDEEEHKDEGEGGEEEDDEDEEVGTEPVGNAGRQEPNHQQLNGQESREESGQEDTGTDANKIASKIDNQENEKVDSAVKSESRQRAGRSSSVKLSLNRQQMIGIRTTQIEKKNLFKSIRAPGRIAFDPELYTAQSEYLEALKQWHRVKNSPVKDVKENSRQMIESSKIRLRVLGLSEEQIGLLAKRGSQSEGLLVSGKGQESWIYADVFEMDLPYIQKGQDAKITATFLKGEVLKGEVLSVDQVINPTTRTAKVRIQLKSSKTAIRPQSYVSVHILAPVGEHLAAPLESIMDTGRETYVFVKKSKGEFEPRQVQIILETETDAALIGDIFEGDEVVIGGNFMLDSESRLRSAIYSEPTETQKDRAE